MTNEGQIITKSINLGPSPMTEKDVLVTFDADGDLVIGDGAVYLTIAQARKLSKWLHATIAPKPRKP